MKKKPIKKKKSETLLSVLQKIQKDTDSMRSALALLVAGNQFVKAVDEIPKAWKTLSIGGKTRGELSKGIQIPEYTNSVLDKVEFPSSTEEISFEIKTLSELGFTTSPTFREFINFIKDSKEYDICKTHDALYLRNEYTDQPKGEWIRLAMENIPDFGGGPSVFGLGRGDDGVWLDGNWYSDGDKLLLGGLWVVRLRK